MKFRDYCFFNYKKYKQIKFPVFLDRDEQLLKTATTSRIQKISNYVQVLVDLLVIYIKDKNKNKNKNSTKKSFTWEDYRKVSRRLIDSSWYTQSYKCNLQ